MAPSYGDPVIQHTRYMCKLEILQKKAISMIRTISKMNYNAHTTPLFKNLQILKLRDIYRSIYTPTFKVNAFIHILHTADPIA